MQWLCNRQYNTMIVLTGNSLHFILTKVNFLILMYSKQYSQTNLMVSVLVNTKWQKNIPLIPQAQQVECVLIIKIAFTCRSWGFCCASPLSCFLDPLSNARKHNKLYWRQSVSEPNLLNPSHLWWFCNKNFIKSNRIMQWLWIIKQWNGSTTF